MVLDKTKMIALFAVIVVAVAAVAAVAIDIDDDDDDRDRDAGGNVLKERYDTDRIITVGVGTLRWMSYFGLEDRVVCIDAGDANASSWNGKAYRSLYDISPSFVNTSSMDPKEAHYTEYGMAVHDHNGFSTSNLEEMRNWSAGNIPTIMVVSESVYNNLTNEEKNGIKRLMDVIVIHEVDSFVDSRMELSRDFEHNLEIIGEVFNKEQRADQLENYIEDMFRDIRQLVKDKTPVLSKAYVGGASQSGSKDLTWSVGSYLPFQLAGITNVKAGSNTVARDYGAEVLSNTDADVMFIDLSGTTKYSSTTSEPVLRYMDENDIPMYAILPYFWFGYNFDNAIANAYLMVYACYDGVLTYDQCMERIYNVYEKFMPNVSDGKDCIDGMMDNFYSIKGSGIVLDGSELKSENGSIVRA